MYFWGDERAVPPDNSDSNYGMARRELLIRVPIPQANVHRMEAEKPNIGRAAHEYEEVLRTYLELIDRASRNSILFFSVWVRTAIPRLCFRALASRGKHRAGSVRR